MTENHSQGFIEQALIKVYSRGDRTIRAVAEDLRVNVHTLKYWMKKNPGRPKDGSSVNREKRPRDWTTQEQLVALHETHGLAGEELQAWCRARGLFAHHLSSWRSAFCQPGDAGSDRAREVHTLKGENVKLRQELMRKDKALAEAAALLVLQKKFRALWEAEE